MKLRVVGLVVPAFLASCSGSSKGPNVTILVQKPEGADDSCLGVVGFEVDAQPVGKEPQLGIILSAAPVQAVADCRLARAFSIADLDVELPATITVTGFDGAHEPRVSGSVPLDNLHVGTQTIVLKVEGTPPPPLILDRGKLLGGIPLAEVATMTVATTGRGQPADLKIVNRALAGAFFDVDPGGFGIEGVQNNQDLTIAFTFTTAGRNLPKVHVITTLDTNVPVFRTQ